jgi:RimJ/RimL family protein N-acetyltransferase
MRTTITTARLTLRPMTAKDIPAVVCGLDDLRVSSMVGHIPYPYTQADGEAWIARQAQMRAGGENYVYGVEDSATGQLAGSVGLHWMDRNSPDGAPMWELGYCYYVPFWGRGFATEAGAAILRELEATLAPPAVVAGHFTENAQSGHVLAKLGFQYTGQTREMACLARGKPVPGLIMIRTAGSALPDPGRPT